MKLTFKDYLQEAQYQDTGAMTLDGYLIAGNHNEKISIAVGDCVDQRLGNAYGDHICYIKDFKGGILTHQYEDALQPGTKVIFGMDKDTRRWYLMPTSDSVIVGWFIRGPTLYDGDDL